MNDVMLTTYDNPYSPFTEFERWLKEDLVLGHDCCGMLSRLASTSSIMKDEINDKNAEDAMDRLIELEPLIYRKVTPSDY